MNSDYAKGRRDAIMSCQDHTKTDMYQPPYPMCSNYAAGWLAGCREWEREHYPHEFEGDGDETL